MSNLDKKVITPPRLQNASESSVIFTVDSLNSKVSCSVRMIEIA